jgi:hypothetical protein
MIKRRQPIALTHRSIYLRDPDPSAATLTWLQTCSNSEGVSGKVRSLQ